MSLIRIRTVMKQTGLSKSYIYSLAALGQFPRPIKIGVRASAWLQSEIDAHVQARIRESRGGVA
jgi:prophage regulatory protein